MFYSSVTAYLVNEKVERFGLPDKTQSYLDTSESPLRNILPEPTQKHFITRRPILSTVEYKRMGGRDELKGGRKKEVRTTGP